MIVAIEGIDGSGKRTQAELLQQFGHAAGIRCCVISFPRYGCTTFANSVSDYLNGKYGDIDESPPHFPALLFAGDRFESLAHILEANINHELVILDRYVASNLAHQAAKLPKGERSGFIDWLAEIEHTVFTMPTADLTVYLSIDASIASTLVLAKPTRTYTRLDADIHEKNSEYLLACQEVYDSLLASSYRSEWQSVQCQTSDGLLRSADDIAAEILALVRSRLV